jgi:hypothetical protein
LAPGDLSCVNVDCVSNGSLHAFKVEVPVTGDLLRHFMDEPLGDVALAPQLLGVSDDLRPRQQLKNGGGQDVFGEIVPAGEGAAGMAIHRFETLEMRGLGGARGVGRPVIWAAFGGLGGFGDEQELAMIERKPGFPLRVRDAGFALQRLAERRQLSARSGYFARKARSAGSPGADPIMSPARCTTASQPAI